MRTFSLLFLFIAFILLIEFVLYVIRGPVDLRIAAVIFVGFLFCLAPAVYLLKPFEGHEELQHRREERRKRRQDSRKGPTDRGS